MKHRYSWKFKWYSYFCYVRYALAYCCNLLYRRTCIVYDTLLPWINKFVNAYCFIGFTHCQLCYLRGYRIGNLSSLMINRCYKWLPLYLLGNMLHGSLQAQRHRHREMTFIVRKLTLRKRKIISSSNKKLKK